MSHPGDNPAFCIAGVEPARPRCAAACHRLEETAARSGWTTRYVDIRHSDEMDETVALVVLAGAGADSARRTFPHALLVSFEDPLGADLVLPPEAEGACLDRLVAHGEEHWRRNLKVLALFREVGARRTRMNQLSDIAKSLSTRMDYSDLLRTILLEARRLADCEAGSLYLIDESGDEPELVFKLAQNDVVEVDYVEKRLPLSRDSLAGYVAVVGEELLIPDAYQIPESVPYRFNRSFDEQMNYRTRSMLVLPMRDHRDQVVGVLQFINRLDPTEDLPIPFDEEIVELLRAVASQAAVSIQKNQLIRDISRLFESFVQASVKTIEQRDPSTSGHSFRVADSTVALLQVLPQSGLSS
ncbi:MAG: GAF domain-containing protein, partial [Pseudomonadales bacterium]|nr:GAF domain-containing protein [Pseudomonadales bacterium]